MSNKADIATTPYYVLKSENLAIFPTIKFDAPDTDCVCVYGFSDKPIYDQFIENATQALTPYPLVKGFLVNQIDSASSVPAEGNPLRLVILDATDPAQPVLSAATMATVLLALQEKTKQVLVEFELVFDQKSAGYRLNDDS